MLNKHRSHQMHVQTVQEKSQVQVKICKSQENFDMDQEIFKSPKSQENAGNAD